MKIIDLSDNYKNIYYVCLEDWSEEMKEAGNHKEVLYSGDKVVFREIDTFDREVFLEWSIGRCIVHKR